MRAEHQYNFFHIYHDRCTVVTFQCKLLLLCNKITYVYKGKNRQGSSRK